MRWQRGSYKVHRTHRNLGSGWSLATATQRQLCQQNAARMPEWLAQRPLFNRKPQLLFLVRPFWSHLSLGQCRRLLGILQI